MNVKKESLRGKILDYLSHNPTSEVKDIAAHVQISKQALYYHIKLLTNQKKIQIVDSQFVNGIEKKFYSLISSEELDNTDHQNVLKDEDSSISPILTESIDKKQSPLPQSNNDNIDNAGDQTLYSPSNESKNDLKSQNLSLDEPDPTKINFDPLKANIDKNKTFQKSPDSKKHNNSKSLDTKIPIIDRLYIIIKNIKNLGLFNLDTYDTYNSATLFITASNKKIAFNNRQSSEFNIHIADENKPISKIIKRNSRLLVVEENFVDNHERIIVPLKKRKDQEAFLKRYILKKYNINEEELIYTYEKFKTKEKDMYELNTLFTRSKYLRSSVEAANEFKTENRLYISLAGIFTYYNFQLGRTAKNEINLYLYMGIKGCELTWIQGHRILYNRTILISNQAISEASYLSEAIPRIVRTIKVSLEELKRDNLVEKEPDNIYVSGPKSNKSIEEYFKENYKVEVQNINVKINKNFNQSQFKELNDYYDTTMILEKSFNRWGRFRYIYDQKNKLDLRKTGVLNVINLMMSITTAILILLNIKLYEQKVVNNYDEISAKLSAEMQLKLINSTEKIISERYKFNKIDKTLGNIQAAKHNSIELIKLLNSQVFKKVDISSMEIKATDPNVYDNKNLEVKITGGVVSRRPEAILEVTNIEESLKQIEYVDNSTVEYRTYQGNKLPVTIAFAI